MKDLKQEVEEMQRLVGQRIMAVEMGDRDDFGSGPGLPLILVEDGSVLKVYGWTDVEAKAAEIERDISRLSESMARLDSELADLTTKRDAWLRKAREAKERE